MTDSERKYIDLIFHASKKYASWDPELPIEVGDWGRITDGRPGITFWRRQRGTFIKDGNIYKDGTAKKYNVPEPKEYGSSAKEGHSWIISNNAQEVEIDIAAGGFMPAMAQCSAKAAFKFSLGSGAVLVMAQDSILSIDPPGILRRLLKEERKMKGCVIVSEVHRTSSYARLLTNEPGICVSIGLDTQLPLTNAVNGSVDAKWICSSKVGNFKSKVDDSRKFTPLFRLVSLREGSVSTGFGENQSFQDAVPHLTKSSSGNVWSKLRFLFHARDSRWALNQSNGNCGQLNKPS